MLSRNATDGRTDRQNCYINIAIKINELFWLNDAVGSWLRETGCEGDKI